ncbi:3-isopropylmalate dehydratase small subunit [Sphingopyxis sp. JAI108]|uniref:3-isopropylmalate dehydratase small subunit n=1 Tax=Sphingopyxis sp. JAI108 TaxID=2723060 RepID=UPI0015CAC116|nr:3-isopropylmalate dehydratase small subunit [Sphingopyxis sp. JAI108]NYF33969.1 3-isopropylmalate dehydratase small subunit [Sphingopyxis sp. JAI108]
MTPFTALSSPALPLLEDRIDTDVIFPARFLLLMRRGDMGRYFFHDRRFEPDGAPIANNPVDDPRYTGAQILIAGADFGSGSSREQAVWALTGFGIRCVIAESFGEIFAANCLRNGVLAIAQPRALIERLAAASGPLDIDLAAQTIAFDDESLAFDIAPGDRERLLKGWDDIDLILEREGPRVAAFEAQQRQTQPWLYGYDA